MRYRDIKTTNDRWQWHAETYAFRRVMLNVPDDVHTSPVDPNGDWFNEGMVDQATTRIRQRRRQPEKPFTFTAEELEERAEWARLKGYPSWSDYLDAIQTGDERISAFLAWSAERRERRHPARVGTFQRIGAIAKPAAE